jgi:hypothetical protein
MTTDNHTKTTPIDQWQQDGLHWEARLWDVAEGHPLTPDEAQRLAEWVAYTVDT